MRRLGPIFGELHVVDFSRQKLPPEKYPFYLDEMEKAVARCTEGSKRLGHAQMAGQDIFIGRGNHCFFVATGACMPSPKPADKCLQDAISAKLTKHFGNGSNPQMVAIDPYYIIQRASLLDGTFSQNNGETYVFGDDKTMEYVFDSETGQCKGKRPLFTWKQTPLEPV